jgi:glyoxylase-like metal-dependent hydrolase (beta-lactamase superfamily II)
LVVAGYLDSLGVIRADTLIPQPSGTFNRTFFSAIKSSVVACITVVALSSAHAQTPMSSDVTLGWYRMRLGQFEITALSDGTLELPVDKIFTKVSPSRIRTLLSRAYLSNEVRLTVNAFLVNTGTRLVLIDTGTGTSQMFGSKLGRLLSNLEASGYSPEQVDEIYVTHMHTDHIGGLMRDGKPSFTNATVRADVREAAFYLSQSKMDAAPTDEKEDFESAMAIFKPYIAATKFKPFDGEAELIPGVRAMPAPGHTPGHTIYVIESQGEKMVVWGDLMHVAALQFPQPSATIQTDWNTKLSAQQRRTNFADIAKNGYYAAAAHVAFPGIGKLRAEGDGYTWVPISYIYGK